MLRRVKPALACLLLALVSQPTNAMIRHVFVFEPPVSIEQFDIWYFQSRAGMCAPLRAVAKAL